MNEFIPENTEMEEIIDTGRESHHHEEEHHHHHGEADTRTVEEKLLLINE